MTPSGQSAIAGQVAIAQEALDEANRRREVAREAVVDFALRAIIDGEDVETIMDACGFKESEQSPNNIFSTFGLNIAGTRRQRFAAWIGQELCNRLAAEPK